ncbi:AraC family transcriptional regulator [Microscilla marina]|uniref:Putative transcriptional regulator n=1 Tax=Microscilla marina ATCC 23134 TaxID=313606 RepID=A1ZX84_MICM2|nr:helix-turn-helix domain-containing protein [Microscilla marina]EAY24958.1 putative transcriptional regulator [Microscilla marina ATCC 23134]
MQQRKHHINFDLQQMENIYEAAQGSTDVPHRHDYYTIMLVEVAKGRHVIDYQSYVFAGCEVFFVNPGQVHQVALQAKPKGWVITFSRDFLVENSIPESFISNINLFRQFGDTPPLSLDEDTFARLKNLIAEMQACLPSSFHYRNRALGALLQLFLIYCSNSCLLDTTQLDEESNGVCIFRDFKKLVEQHYQQWHKVGTYASEIPISPKHLSHTVKKLTGKSAKEFIQDRLILEGKRLLIHTRLNIKQIAYELGFEEPLHFSNFFKKKAQVSPSEFRQQKNR